MAGQGRRQRAGHRVEGAGGSKPYGVLDHTADIGLWVRGRDLEALFSNAALGLRELLELPEAPRRPAAAPGGRGAPAGAATPPGAAPPGPERLVVLQASDAEALLVDWLNELLYLLDTERLAPVGAEVELRGGALRALVRMEEVGPGRAPRREPKAATFHGLKITEAPGGLEARVIFDI